MSFMTIPDTNNYPVMINIDLIESLSITEEGIINVNFSSGNIVSTLMPRNILVEMINKISRKPKMVETHTEFAG